MKKVYERLEISIMEISMDVITSSVEDGKGTYVPDEWDEYNPTTPLFG